MRGHKAIMYAWRKMTPEQRAEALKQRQQLHWPLHSPPHFFDGRHHNYHLTAANYEHAVILGKNQARLLAFSRQLYHLFDRGAAKVHAWCVLPNHWHALVGTNDLKALLFQIGRLHGRSSFDWNKEDGQRGRKCWHRCADRSIRGSDHFYVVRNYVHHNPVKHGYVDSWQDWPYSSAIEYLRDVGEDMARDLWVHYPILDMGKGWDD